MRTTIDLPEALLEQAKGVAASGGNTMRELVIEGLSEVVSRRLAASVTAYHLPECAVDGQGLQPGVGDLRWDSVRDLVHDEASRWPKA